MLEVSADRHECQSYGNCVLKAPDLFDLDDNGVVVVLDKTPGEEHRQQALSAVRACPVRALSLTG